MADDNSNPEIAVLGEVMVELAPTGNNSYRMGVAGDTFNTAAALAQLGVRVSYLTMLGEERYSRGIIERMAELGIDDRWVLCDSNRQVGLYIIDNTPDGERYFTYWRSESAARGLFGSAQRLAEQLEQLTAVPAIYISGITLALCTNESLECLFNFFKRYSGCIYYDCNYRPVLWPDRAIASGVNSRMRDLCHVYLPGLEDEQNLGSFSNQQAVWECLTADSKREVVMTAGGAEISVWSDGISHYWQPPPVAPVVDTTGAGDSFNGAYIAAKLNGLVPMEAAQFACKVAAQVIGERGAILASGRWMPLQRKLQELANHG